VPENATFPHASAKRNLFLQLNNLVVAPHINSPPGYTACLRYHNLENVTQNSFIDKKKITHLLL
jgi:hypothetical protein